ncbi:MAG TPA: serine/threonine-protein kinase, partial [Thermoanaerobaculia bacterium]|nr:serine/threonine-protein kinase [Thermoanaerobaculia bacterium]
RREARIIARLEHPGIVPVHDVGVLPDGRIFYAMKLVRGARLDEWARGQRSLTERLRAFVRVCEAVAFAHANGVVHRDLKPENVMVGELGAVLVMDWGVATHAGESDATVAGTPGYIPPETEIDARTDVFALGKILESLIADAPPRQLEAISAKAAALDREVRYRDARELAEDVLRFLDAEPVSAYRENAFEVAWRWMIKYRALLAIVAAYLVMRAIVLLWARL